MVVDNFPGGKPVVILGSDGTYLHALLADALHRLVVAVGASELPDGAATSANQTTMITALQLIDDLRGALDSVGTDELDVNVESSVLPTGAATQTTLAGMQSQIGAVGGGDAGTLLAYLLACQTALQIIDGFAHQLNTIWAYNDRYSQRLTHTTVGAATYDMDFTAVPAGEVWVIENVAARDAGTIVRIYLRGRTNAGVLVNLKGETLTVVSDWVTWGGRLVLKYQDHVRISFISAQDGDPLEGHAWGYKMKV